METKNDVIYFDNDQEFEDWAVAPYATVKYTEKGNIPYTTGDYSNEYKEAIGNNKRFIIKDEDSVVFKRKCVSKRVPLKVDGFPSYTPSVLVQLNIENLEAYFADLA